MVSLEIPRFLLRTTRYMMPATTAASINTSHPNRGRVQTLVTRPAKHPVSR